MYDFGENIFMNNEKYLDELDGRLQVLNELRKRIIELSKAIIGDTLYKEDFFFTSAMDRSVVLLDGISEMIKNRNLACGGILLRSQIDNCMRMQLMRIYILSTHSVRWHVIKSGSAYRKEKWRTKNMHSGVFFSDLASSEKSTKWSGRFCLKILLGPLHLRMGKISKFK